MVNSLTTNDASWRCLTLTACYQLAQSVLMIGLALAKKDGIVGDGQAYSRHATHMAASLVNTGWTISHLVSTSGCRNHSPLVS